MAATVQPQRLFQMRLLRVRNPQALHARGQARWRLEKRTKQQQKLEKKNQIELSNIVVDFDISVQFYFISVGVESQPSYKRCVDQSEIGKNNCLKVALMQLAGTISGKVQNRVQRYALRFDDRSQLSSIDHTKPQIIMVQFFLVTLCAHCLMTDKCGARAHTLHHILSALGFTKSIKRQTWRTRQLCACAHN